MKKLLLSTAVAMTFATTAQAADPVKLGVLLGFTGAIESTVADMGPAADMAVAEVNAGGGILGGRMIEVVRGDSTCTDSAAATASAERLITSDKVSGIVGGDCSGVTTAVLTNVAVPNGMVMVSPSATSPALTTVEDNGLFFRTAPSDARQGAVMSDIIMGKDIKKVALTYTNNDYGKGLADAFQKSYEAAGGKVTASISHEDGKADYSAEVGALAAAGGEVLVVAGYVDQGGKGIIQGSLDTGAFDTFVLPDGMASNKLGEAIGSDLNGSFGQTPGANNAGAQVFEKSAKGFNGTGPFTKETYDAAALILLAMEAAKSTDPKDYKSKIMDVANAPGVKINPGELKWGLLILANGGDIDYVGASNVELIGVGESSGNYREYEIKDKVMSTVRYR